MPTLDQMNPSVLQPEERSAIKRRIALLTNGNKGNWGKMDVPRMVQHCVIWNEWVLGLGGPQFKQNFIGKLIGPWALKRTLRPGKPFDKGIPAGKHFEVRTATIDLEQAKQRWMELIDAYADLANPGFVHDFFGRMSNEEIGIFVHKHMDHHLRQFGV